MKKIVHITTVHARYDNRILEKQCVSLAKAGFHIVLMVADGKGNEGYKGVNIIDIGKPRGVPYRILITPFLIFLSVLKNKAKVIQIHDPELLFLALCLRFCGKTVIYDVHEDYRTAIGQKKYLNTFFKKIFIFSYALLEKISSKFLVILLAEKYYLDFLPQGHLLLNYPIVDNQLAADELEDFKINSKEIELLYTGNVSEVRGAFTQSKIVDFVNKVKVTFVGFCPEMLAEEIMSNITNKEMITIIGRGQFVQQEKIVEVYNQQKWLAGLAIFPLTMHYEKKELTKFFEYMLHGIPIICSNFPYWERFVTENQCGIAVDPHNEEEINNAIIKLFEDSELRRKFANNGRKLVLEELNWQKESEKLISLYSSFFYIK